MNKNKLIFFWFVFSFWSCSRKENKTDNIIENPIIADTIKNIEHICEHRDLSKLFDFKTKINRYVGTSTFDSCKVEIAIIDKETRKEVQKITYNSTYFFEDAFANCNYCRSFVTGKNKNQDVADNDYGDIIVADFNFDKKDDIALKHDSGGNGGPFYDYYIQDRNQQFSINTFLTDSMGYFPTYINSQDKTLITIVHANAYQIGETTYKFYEDIGKWEKIKHRFIDAN